MIACGALTFGAPALGARATGATAPGASAIDAPPAAYEPNLAGTVHLTFSRGTCSGALVRFPGHVGTDPAVLQTNGHCVQSSTDGRDEIVVGKALKAKAILRDASGGDALTLKTVKTLYSTQKWTDAAWIEVDKTYDEIATAAPAAGKPMELAPTAPALGTSIAIVSGRWKKITRCGVEKIVPRLWEDGFLNTESIRYTTGCETAPGWSGSPLVDASTGVVVGIHNTTNEKGERCTASNPCETDDNNGNLETVKGRRYGQQTWWVLTCLADDRKTIDIDRKGCRLPTEDSPKTPAPPTRVVSNSDPARWVGSARR